MALSRGTVIALGVIALVAVFLIGLMVGFLSKPTSSEEKLLQRLTSGEKEGIQSRLSQQMTADNIEEYLRRLTKEPHLAGTKADLEQAQYLKTVWDEQGLDRTALYPYDILLSYPDPDNPNKVILYEGSEVNHTSSQYEKVLAEGEDHPDVVAPYNAYAAAGMPRGDPVYVNYARIEDFQWLNNTKKLDLIGKICIARYGRLFRGTKAKLAEQFGCAGLIIYSDPEDYVSVFDNGEVYPQTWSLPDSGVQRGNIITEKGDPLTPGYPAIKSAYRYKEEDATALPTLPVHPISYGDAKMFLQGMAGDEAPSEWKGGLAISYRLGPGYVENDRSIQLIVNNQRRNVTTYNVMGFIEGAVEPDRYVMIGNHRDAWVFGGVDPSSGTATMMEVSRAYGQLLKEGWRPRRSVIFCSWGAEEHGLMGSSEWVEHYGKLLEKRTVVYINIDIAVTGNYSWSAKAQPMLNPLIYQVAKTIANPDRDEVAEGRLSVYDTWLIRRPHPDPESDKPEISLVGSGSDFAPFVGQIGVTCANLHFSHNGGYPLYHTLHDTFQLVKTFIDPEFRFHLATAQFAGEFARRLADSFLLPYDVREYASAIQNYIRAVEDTEGDELRQRDMGSSLEFLKEAGDTFAKVAQEFHGKLEEAEISKNPVLVRLLNDQMMQLERVFVDPLGLPGRKLIRHVVYAPSQHNLYAGASFPGLTDTLWEAKNSAASSAGEEEERWESVKKQLAVLAYFIETAAASLKQTIQF